MFHVDLELDRIIAEGLCCEASDIHFDAIKEGISIRFRIDGVLEHKSIILGDNAIALGNRIKVCSGLDISERRIPQDGRWFWEDQKKQVTMRVSTLPSLYGETIVCRLLRNQGANLGLAELGMTKDIVQEVKELLDRPYGLLLVCGPTGSGKTATLYALLRTLRSDLETVISLENPVEVSIPGVVQVQINEKTGLTFEKGLRAVLRQDPDTIMVGEIRDNETAQLAIQAALTGHRVLSTIHTNTAVGVVERLIDMGVEPYLVRATLMGAISQRLVRRRKDNEYKGRIAVFELLTIPKSDAQWEHLETHVYRSLENSAKILCEKGISTIEECKRVGIVW